MKHWYDWECHQNQFLKYVVLLVNMDKGKILTIDLVMEYHVKISLDLGFIVLIIILKTPVPDKVF
jgi:hypothetical protein